MEFHEDGTPLADVEPPADPEFALSDHRDFTEREADLLAERGHTVVCGGMSGVMEAACRGASEADGETIGILPGEAAGPPTSTSTRQSRSVWGMRGTRSSC